MRGERSPRRSLPPGRSLCRRRRLSEAKPAARRGVAKPAAKTAAKPAVRKAAAKPAAKKARGWPSTTTARALRPRRTFAHDGTQHHVVLQDAVADGTPHQVAKGLRQKGLRMTRQPGPSRLVSGAQRFVAYGGRGQYDLASPWLLAVWTPIVPCSRWTRLSIAPNERPALLRLRVVLGSPVVHAAVPGRRHRDPRSGAGSAADGLVEQLADDRVQGDVRRLADPFLSARRSCRGPTPEPVRRPDLRGGWLGAPARSPGRVVVHDRPEGEREVAQLANDLPLPA